jgi:hypothetical protein
LEEVAVHAGHEVWLKADDNIFLIVANLHGILDLQLRHGLILFLNITILLINYNKLYINKKFK